jgi:cyclopropane-fatty-acyl-phospholipid synthase
MFFSKLNAILESGALGLLHTIGHNEPLPTDPWTLKYIFPGGYLPSLEELVKRLRKKKFYIIDVENLRFHYAKTIEHWIEHFEKNIDKVKQMFDEKFIRMWRLYLNGAYGSFKWGDTQLYQIVFSKGQIQIPLYRGHIYNTWKGDV